MFGERLEKRLALTMDLGVFLNGDGSTDFQNFPILANNFGKEDAAFLKAISMATVAFPS